MQKSQEYAATWFGPDQMDTERVELLEYVKTTLSESLFDLPAASGRVDACVYLIRHLAGRNVFVN